MTTTVEALMPRQVRCPCGITLPYRQYKRSSIRKSARNALRAHLVEVHPGFRVRERSLILDEAVEGI